MTPYQHALAETMTVFESLKQLEPSVETAASWCLQSLNAGHKLLICGNGGSAAESVHLAGELVGRYKHDRQPLAAIALTADSALLTCIGNDYNFDDVFSRQIRALGQKGDTLIAFTTSGNSPNVVRALEAARNMDLRSIAFLGRDGGKAAQLADCSLIVRHPDTARCQEGHQFLMHSLMDLIEAQLREED